MSYHAEIPSPDSTHDIENKPHTT